MSVCVRASERACVRVCLSVFLVCVVVLLCGRPGNVPHRVMVQLMSVALLLIMETWQGQGTVELAWQATNKVSYLMINMYTVRSIAYAHFLNVNHIKYFIDLNKHGNFILSICIFVFMNNKYIPCIILCRNDWYQSVIF